MLVIENTLPFFSPTPTTPYVGALADGVRRVDHLRETAALVLHQHVRQQQRKRLVADKLARAPYRMAQAQRLLLAREAGGAGLRQVMAQDVQRLLLLPLEQRHFQLELPIEMILDDALVAPGDEDEMLDAGFAGLVDNVLDQRPVDHRQHFLRHRLGGGQKPGAEAGHGKDSFTDGFHRVPLAEGEGD
jgi:hypothetical protein